MKKIITLLIMPVLAIGLISLNLDRFGKSEKTNTLEAEEIAYNLTLTIVGHGSVTPGSGSLTGFVDLEATPDAGYKFAGWSGDLGGSISPMPLVMGSDKNVTASFVAEDAPMHKITTTKEGSGIILKTKSRAWEGEVVDLYAIPDAGHMFVGWKGDLTGNINPVSITVDSEKNISAAFLSFTPPTYYVAADGDDANPGTKEAPYASLGKALALSNPGTVVYVMPGIYDSNHYLSGRSGDPGNLIHFVAYDLNDKPVFKRGVTVENCSYLHLKGFEITQASFKTSGVNTHHNVYENFDVHHVNAQVAFNVSDRTHDNLMINCDFHNNVLHSGSNADGIAMWGVNGTTNGPFNNTLLYCRSFFNNDDGFDTWWAGSNNRFESCWAYGNGRDSTFADIEGDGNGFKLGQGKPSNLLINCLAWKNRNTGFDQNSNTGGGLTIMNCSAYDNSYHDFDFWESPKTSVIRNCVSYIGRTSLDAADDKYNSWNLNNITVTDDDFLTIDFSANMGERNPDGSLPESDFLKLKEGSDLIDAGTDVGLPFNGSAPDLGAYEFIPDSTTSINTIKEDYILNNYPNPFYDHTTFTYTVNNPSEVRLAIYNLSGKEIAVLVDQQQQPGNYSINWNIGNNSQAFPAQTTYLCKLNVGQDIRSKRIIHVGR